MKKGLLAFLLLTGLLMGCNDKPAADPKGEEPATEPATDPSQGGDSSGEGEPVTPPAPVEYTHTVSFNTTNTMNTDKRDDFHTKMKNYINGDKNIIDSVSSSDYVQIGKFDQNTATGKDQLTSIYALSLGGKSQNGSLTLNFVDTLKSVSINAQAYYKLYWDYKTEQPAVSVDEVSKITVQGTTWDLTCSDKTKASVAVDKVFEINGKSLTVSGNASERVFINSMTFTLVK